MKELGGHIIRIKNPAISTQRRKHNRRNKGDDIEDRYIIGNKKAWPWWCKKCGSKLEPYKEDEYGDIIMSCTNPHCIMNKAFEGSMTIQLKKLFKQQQMNSQLYYRNYKGGYY